MNLVLPFLICGLISFAIKLLVMPSYSIDRIIRKIQNNKILREIVLKGEIKLPKNIKVQPKNKDKKDNNGDNNKLEIDNNEVHTFESEKSK